MQTVTVQNPSLTQALPTSITTILATPAVNTAFLVSGVSFCNTTNAAVTINFSCYNGTVDTYIAYQQTINAYDTLTFGGDFFKAVITNGFSLRALASVASSVHVAIFYTQFT